ncbi:MAG: zinc-ribbon domain-containing protein [Blautia sp.]|nr:zinc-ribbon domain-containing protein [Blautia sp.]
MVKKRTTNSGDRWSDFSKSMSRTLDNIKDGVSTIYETQRFKSKISNHHRQIEKLKTDIGTLILTRFEEGEVYEGELQRLCEEIKKHQLLISRLEEENANFRGKKICPSCRKEIPLDAAFCPACGTHYPMKSEEGEGMHIVSEDAFEPDYMGDMEASDGDE